MRTRSLRFSAAVVLSWFLGSCSSPPSLLEQIIHDGELRVVTQNSPATFYDELRGIEVELARGFAERLGVSLKLYAADEFRQLFPDILSGKAHIGAAGLLVNDWRQEQVAFGPAYQTVQPQLIYRMGTKRPKSLADVHGRTLEVLEGSAHVQLLEEARRANHNLRWTENRAVSAEALIRRVTRGEVDYAIVNSNEFSLLRHYYPEAKAAFDLGAASQVAWALPKGAEDLRESVAAYFAEIEATGELAQILDRYYYASRDFDFVGSRAFVRHLGSRFPQYQQLFEEAALETGIDWRLLAAISYQESHWDAGAVSPTGVRGLMMLTEITAEMMDVDDRSDPRASIFGGARYFERVLQKIPERIPPEDRMLLAIAAYNIGFGHVEDARIITEIQGGNPDSWEEVRARLPLLSDENWHKRVQRGFARGAVPVGYVDNVRRYYALLQWMADTEILSDEPPPPVNEVRS
jgi:membrane-bound lytic murein transglycosylase F